MISPSTKRLAPTLLKKITEAGYLLRPPITAAQLKKLVAASGSLPEGVTRYLATSDGLKHPELEPICGSAQMLKPYPSSSLLPLKGDGCGDYDAVMIEPGFGFGAVVFWDHEPRKAAYLIASSVPKYLELLVSVPDSDRWSPDGLNQNEFLRAHDAEAARLLDDPAFAALVGPSGKEFGLELRAAPAPGEPLPKGAIEAIDPFTRERLVIMPPAKYRTPPTRG